MGVCLIFIYSTEKERERERERVRGRNHITQPKEHVKYSRWRYATQNLTFHPPLSPLNAFEIMDGEIYDGSLPHTASIPLPRYFNSKPSFIGSVPFFDG